MDNASEEGKQKKPNIQIRRLSEFLDMVRIQELVMWLIDKFDLIENKM